MVKPTHLCRWREDLPMKCALGLVVVALLALAGCTAHAKAHNRVVSISTLGTTTTVTTASTVVTSSTLQRLAAIAQSAAATWSEPHPWDIRTALGGESKAQSLGIPFLVGASSPRFVIALDGRFVCKLPACPTPSGGGPNPSVLSTAVTTQPPVMTMLLTVDPSTLARDPSIGVQVQDVDMGTLGKVYILDEYLNG